MRPWRLILDGAGDGAWNMAVDRALLDSYEAGEAGPTLRLYGWNRPTVSLGRFQPVEDVSAEACERYGIALCRRPTGGRGVLHADEVTYSMVTGVRDGLPRGTSASYRWLCQALVSAYRELGVPASLTARERGPKGSGACYLHSTAADLSLGVAKLSGSAQVWAKDACLQHGSFVISRDVEREAAVFGLDAEAAAALAVSTATIEASLGRRPEEAELQRLLLLGLGDGIGAELVSGELSAAESSQAETLVSVYAAAFH